MGKMDECPGTTELSRGRERANEKRAFEKKQKREVTKQKLLFLYRKRFHLIHRWINASSDRGIRPHIDESASNPI